MLARTFHTPATASASDALSTGVFPKNARLHSAAMRGRLFRKERLYLQHHSHSRYGGV